MEESDPRGIEMDSTDAAREAARADLAVAESEYASAVDAMRIQARADVSEAERLIGQGTDTLAGIAQVMADEAAVPITKWQNKVAAKAVAALNDVYQTLYGAGAAPPIDTPSLIADIEHDDVYDSAMMHWIMPVLSACPEGQSWDDITQQCSAPASVRPSPELPPPAPDVIVPAPPVVSWTCTPTVPPPVCTPPVDPVSPPTSPPVADDDTGEYPAPPCDVWDEELGEYRPARDDEECAADDEPAPPPAAPPRPRPYRPAAPAGVPAADLQTGDWSSPARCRSGGRVPSGVADEVAATVVEMYRERIAEATWLDAQETARLQAALDAAGETRRQQPVTDRMGMLRPEMERMTRIIGASHPGICEIDWGAVRTLVAKRLLDAHIGGPWAYLTTGDMYDLQYSCPQYIPGQENVDNMYTTGVIDKDMWQCLTRANGNHVWARELVLRASRSQPLPSELLKMMRMGLIDETDFRARMSNVGWTDKTEQEIYVKAQSYIPTYQDIVRMMVRDVADQDVVDSAKLDVGFADKYKGVLRDWAKVNNIDDTVMQYIWRAHWRTPSYTQGVSMVHRLRPGRVAKGLEFTEKDLAHMLKIDDMAPGYVPQMVAMSYNAITRTDIKQFLLNGAIDKVECVQSLMDTGYNERDAVRITDAWSYEVANSRANRSRLWTRSAITKRYIAGEIDRDTAGKLLERTIPDAAERLGILDDADLMRRIQSRAICIKGVKRRRITGEINEMDSRRELVALGMDVTQAVTIAEGWTCHIQTMQREPTVAQMSDWFVQGIIDVSEFDRRLRNLRYTPTDANRIIQTVVLHEQERRAKLAQQQAEKLERRVEKARKEQERQEKERKNEEAARRKQQGLPPQE